GPDDIARTYLQPLRCRPRFFSVFSRFTWGLPAGSVFVEGGDDPGRPRASLGRPFMRRSLRHMRTRPYSASRTARSLARDRTRLSALKGAFAKMRSGARLEAGHRGRRLDT